MAVDRYLMTMMPEEADGSLDNERYVQLPIGSMNGVTLVMQKITICRDTFRKLFCLSIAEEGQLLRWSKGFTGSRKGRWCNDDTMLKVHRCRVLPRDMIDEEIGHRIHPHLQKAKRTGIRKRIKRPKVEGEDLFWSNLEQIERRGVVQRPLAPMTRLEKKEFGEQWEKQTELVSRRFKRFSQGMIRNDRQNPRFNAFVYSWAEETEEDRRWRCRTMWVPLEGYLYDGNYYKFRIDSYFKELWFREHGKVMQGEVFGNPGRLFRYLMDIPGTLSCRMFSDVALRRSYVMEPPSVPYKNESQDIDVEKDPDWVEVHGGKHRENETWFWQRKNAYPLDDDEEPIPSWKAAKHSFTRYLDSVEVGGDKMSWMTAFTTEFGHQPDWDRNKWTKYWQEEFRALCHLETLGFIQGRPPQLRHPAVDDQFLFCGVRGITSDTYDCYGEKHHHSSYASFCMRVYVVGLEKAFQDEFGHSPTTDMNEWSTNRSAERRAYWVVTGKRHDDYPQSHPKHLCGWGDRKSGFRQFQRHLPTAMDWYVLMPEPSPALALQRDYFEKENYFDEESIVQQYNHTANSPEQVTKSTLSPPIQFSLNPVVNPASVDVQSDMIPKKLQMSVGYSKNKEVSLGWYDPGGDRLSPLGGQKVGGHPIPAVITITKMAKGEEVPRISPIFFALNDPV
ncbi:MAG: hypothetical protein ACRC2P_01490 [Eubacterium aggregans]